MKRHTLILALCGLICLAGCASTDFDENYQSPYGADAVCPKGWVETANTGAGDATICCPVGTIGVDGLCVDEPISFETQPQDFPAPQDVVADGVKPQIKIVQADKNEGFVLLSAPNSKGSAYCPARSNSLAWNGSEFKCCGKGMKSVAVPSRSDSICCPTSSDSARWVGEKWNDYECCPEGTTEIKNTGKGAKYVCCHVGQKALDGECYSIK